MRMMYFALLLVALFTPQIVQTEVREIPLSNVTGFYSGDSSYVIIDSFQLDPPPTSINSVWILLSGDHTSGAVVCTGDTILTGAHFDAWMKPEVGRWLASINIAGSASEFSETPYFHSIFGATWSFLLHGSGKVTIWYNYGAGVPICLILKEPDAFVREAILFIDGEFPLPTDDYTWGRIKELYKN